MRTTKLALGVAAGLAIALLAGWTWGRSGHAGTARTLETSELSGELVGARAAVLDARLAIYSINFGEASSHLEDARGLVARAADRLDRLGRVDDARQMQAALERIAAAQRMAGKLDQSANLRAGEAAQLLANVAEATAKR